MNCLLRAVGCLDDLSLLRWGRSLGLLCPLKHWVKHMRGPRGTAEECRGSVAHWETPAAQNCLHQVPDGYTSHLKERGP